MYRLYPVLLLCSAVAYNNAAETLCCAGVEKPAEFADQEGCYVRNMNKVIPHGDCYIKPCSKITCHANDTAELFTCDVQDVHEDRRCRLISNESADYPDCCPVVMCSTFPPEAWKDIDESTEATGLKP